MTLGLPLSKAVVGALLGTLALVVGILILTFVISRLASRRLRGALERGGLQVNAAILLARALRATVWTIGIVTVLEIVGVGLTPAAAVIGVLGLAVSLSLQTVMQNLVAGIYLLAERPFSIGDVITVVGPAGLNHEGTVEDIQMRTTHLRSRDAELILVPNAAVFSGVVTNRTAVGGYITQVSVTFPREVDLEAVRQQVLRVLRGVAGILSIPEPELRVDRVEKDGWTASLLFWSGHRGTGSDAVWALAHAFPQATVNGGSGLMNGGNAGP